MNIKPKSHIYYKFCKHTKANKSKVEILVHLLMIGFQSNCAWVLNLNQCDYK